MEHGVVIYSAAVFLLILAGLAVRRRPRIHIPVMLTAFALDLGSVVYLQVQRRAVQTAVNEPTTILKIHVAFAIGTILLYALMVATGWRLAKTGKGRTGHRIGAGTFLLFRFSTLATSLFVT